MSGDIREELLKIFPDAAPAPAAQPVVVVVTPKIPTLRSIHPPVCGLSVQEAFNRFCNEYCGKDLIDPRGVAISISEHNFPKLIKLYTRPSDGRLAAKAKASKVLPSLKAGTFDPDPYTWHMGRLDCLFWLSDVITDPDGIYPNAAARVQGEEVYVKRYAKMGREMKLVFVALSRAGERIVITSFLDDPSTITAYCGMPTLYERH